MLRELADGHLSAASSDDADRFEQLIGRSLTALERTIYKAGFMGGVSFGVDYAKKLIVGLSCDPTE